MARKRQEDPPKGSPAWMATFSDLMNLLLCFFVMLFAMSTVDAEKFDAVVASLQSAFSILPSGGASIGEGAMVSAGISQLQLYDVYFDEKADSSSEEESDGEEIDVREEFRAEALEESEKMAEEISELVSQFGIQDQIEVDFNAEYVLLNMNGTFLFDSAKAEMRAEAYPLIDKVGKILLKYDKNIIEVEGHTDNVPMTSKVFRDNNELSMQRALSVADYLRETTTINPAYLKSSGRGEYVPIADNSTAEGRARNRRVEIKIYNSYYSEIN